MVDAETKRPVAGAEITSSVLFRVAVSDLSGEYVIEDSATFPRGQVTLGAVRSGYYPDLQEVFGTCGHDMVYVPGQRQVCDKQIDFHLRPLGAQLQLEKRTCGVPGTVLTIAGAPIAGAIVELRGTKMGALTDSVGAFTLRKVPTGLYMFRIRFLGYSNEETLGLVNCDESGTARELRFRLSPNEVRL